MSMNIVGDCSIRSQGNIFKDYCTWIILGGQENTPYVVNQLGEIPGEYEGKHTMMEDNFPKG